MVTVYLARPELTGNIGIEVNSIRTKVNEESYTCTFLRPLELSKGGMQFNINNKNEWNVMIAKGRLASNNEQVARHGFFANDRRIHQGINCFQSTANVIVENDPNSEATSAVSATTNGKGYSDVGDSMIVTIKRCW